MIQKTHRRGWRANAVRRIWVATFGAAVGSVGCAHSTGTAPPATMVGEQAPSVPPAGEKLYIANAGDATITVVDQNRLTIDTVIDLRALGFTANAQPHHVAVENDGRFWFVTLTGDNRVLKFDRHNTLLAQVIMESPGVLAIDALHDSLYVSRSMAAVNPPKSLGVITRRSFILVDEQDVGIARPHAIATSGDGKWIYTASLADNKIATVDVATGRVMTSTIPGAPRSLVSLAVSPNGHTMVAADVASDALLVFDIRALPPRRSSHEIFLNGRPSEARFTSDGWHVLVALSNKSEVADVGMATHTVLRRFGGQLAQPYSLVIRRDGRYAFVANQNTGAMSSGKNDHAKQTLGATGNRKDGWLTIINVVTGETIGTLRLGAAPIGMGAAK